MSAGSFSAWLNRMNLDDSAAAEALGCHRHTVRRYRTGGAPIPLYIALACAAIAHGLKPITPLSPHLGANLSRVKRSRSAPPAGSTGTTHDFRGPAIRPEPTIDDLPTDSEGE